MIYINIQKLLDELIHLHMRKSQIKMPSKAEKIIKKSTVLFLGTVGVFLIQVLWLCSVETYYTPEIIWIFCSCEMVLLTLTLFPGLKNKRTRGFLAAITLIELILFLLDDPIQTSEVLFILIFLIRIYTLIQLFKTITSKFYLANSN